MSALLAPVGRGPKADHAAARGIPLGCLAQVLQAFGGKGNMQDAGTVPRARPWHDSASMPAAERFHRHAHFWVTPHRGAGPYRPSKNHSPRRLASLSPGPGTATGRGDDGETTPYSEAEGPARTRLA